MNQVTPPSTEQVKKILDQAMNKNPNVPILGKGSKQVAEPGVQLPTVQLMLLTLDRGFSAVDTKEPFEIVMEDIQNAPIGKVWENGDFTADKLNAGEVHYRLVKVMADLLVGAHGRKSKKEGNMPSIEMALFQFPVKVDKKKDDTSKSGEN